MNDCLVAYIERDVDCNIDNETIIQRFQNMKTRRRQLISFMYLRFYIFIYFFYFLLLLLSIYEFLFLLDCIIYAS